MNPQDAGLSDDEGHVWPARLMIRDTKLHDDMGGGGQRIYTTAGRGYKKVEYVRVDLSHPAQSVSTGDGENAATKRMCLATGLDWDELPEISAHDGTEDREWFRMLARSALTLSTSEASQPVAEGWKMVPVEPTEAMVRAANEAHQAVGLPKLAYAAMLSAAPSPEASQPDAGEVTLPKLPKPAGRNYDHGADMGMPYFSEEQMFAYAKRAALPALSPTDGANNGAASEGER